MFIEHQRFYRARETRSLAWIPISNFLEPDCHSFFPSLRISRSALSRNEIGFKETARSSGHSVKTKRREKNKKKCTYTKVYIYNIYIYTSCKYPWPKKPFENLSSLGWRSSKRCANTFPASFCAAEGLTLLIQKLARVLFPLH